VESLIHDLIQVLERQKGLLQEMLEAARHHNLALRQNDLALLKDAISQEEELSTQLKAGELQQGQIQMALREKLNLPEDAPWSTMVAGLPESFKAGLSGLAGEMRGIAGAIAEVVELNRILTHQAMHFNSQLLHLLKAAPNSMYQPDGKSSGFANLSSALINKTV